MVGSTGSGDFPGGGSLLKYMISPFSPPKTDQFVSPYLLFAASRTRARAVQQSSVNSKA